MTTATAIRNDDGLAYGLIMIVLYFGAAVLIWMGWAAVVDNLLAVMINPYIAAGDVSLQTAHATAWSVNFLRYCVPVILIFGLVFSVNWAIYKTGGGAATFNTFWWGFLAFLIFTIAGIVMAFYGGYFLDTMTNDVVSRLPNPDPAMTDQMQADIYWFINLFYLVCDFMPVLGGAIWGQSIVKRVRVSQYAYA